MVRRMKDDEFRLNQLAHRLDPHIAPINQLVDRLQNQDGRGWLPSVAPMHGGVDALVLSVLSDPGPATRDGPGSGFLCVENNDQTAESQAKLLSHYGISPRLVLPWNAYPWYIDRPPTARERDAGAQILCELVDLAPKLRVVLLQGGQAVDVWKRVSRLRPQIAQQRDLAVIESIHPSRQALRTRDSDERQRRLMKQAKAFEDVAKVLRT
jgi:hypothetical protein